MGVVTVRLHDVVFGWRGGERLFGPLRCDLERGWTGLIGPNGAGKSTLLAIVRGVLRPTRGEVQVGGDDEPVVGWCAQRVEAMDEAIERFGYGWDGATMRLKSMLRLDEGELWRWETLSPGERKRWQLGAALDLRPDVLLLDEPTNHLDAQGLELVLAALAEFGGVELVVSHDRAFLDALTSRTLRLERGALDALPLPCSEALAQWELEDAARWDALAAASRHARRAEAVAHQRAAAAQQASAQINHSARTRDPKDHDARSMGAKARVMSASASLSRQAGVARGEVARAREAVDALRPAARARGRSVHVAQERCPRPVALSLVHHRLEAGDRTLCEDVTLQIGREDRVHLAGANGAGKSTLLRALKAACTLPDERVLWLPQQLGAAQSAALLDEVRETPPEVRGEVLGIVAALGGDPDRVLAAEALSPGMARQLALAWGLVRRVWALVLDEPTNHLDLPARRRLEDALAGYEGALLLVCHDEAFARACTTRRLVLADGSLREVFASR